MYAVVLEIGQLHLRERLDLMGSDGLDFSENMLNVGKEKLKAF